MKRSLLLLGIALLLAGSCRNGSVKTSFGRIIPTENGMLLPMARETGEKQDDYIVGLVFGDDGIYLRCRKPLLTCYMGFLYQLPDMPKPSVLTADLVFSDRSGDINVYSLPYAWLPPRDILENTRELCVYYAPEAKKLPRVIEKNDQGQEFLLPVFTGYYYAFNREEIRKWFAPLLERRP